MVATQQRYATIAKSTDSYVSAIKSWVAFSDLLQVNPLYPSSYDVSSWVACMRKGSSAKTYVSSLRWICRNQNVLPLEWDTDFLKQQLDGFEKMTRTKSDFLYIDWSLARKLVVFSNRRDRKEQACLYAVAASMMPRVQNAPASLERLGKAFRRSH